MPLHLRTKIDIDVNETVKERADARAARVAA
jgi:hypothetical protein